MANRHCTSSFRGKYCEWKTDTQHKTRTATANGLCRGSALRHTTFKVEQAQHSAPTATLRYLWEDALTYCTCVAFASTGNPKIPIGGDLKGGVGRGAREHAALALLLADTTGQQDVTICAFSAPDNIKASKMEGWRGREAKLRKLVLKKSTADADHRVMHE